VLFTLPILTAVILLSPSLSAFILGGGEYTIPFILILSASAIIDIMLVAVLVKPLATNGAALARIAMFLTAFLLMQKILASKAIKIDWSHFRMTIALAAVVALPLAAIDYTLTYPYPVSPIARLILEGIFFLTVYTISLRLFTIVEREDLELLKKALPHQLEKILNMLEGFIIHKALTLTEKTYLTLH